jgi:plasmid rolling circle replication initiator protein Rep
MGLWGGRDMLDRYLNQEPRVRVQFKKLGLSDVRDADDLLAGADD